MTPERSRALRQVAISYAIVNVLVFVFSRSGARQWGLHELIGALFLIAALRSVRADDDDTVRYGISLAGVFPGRRGDERSLLRTVWEGLPLAVRELLLAALVAAIVFPVYAFFWPKFNYTPAQRSFALTPARWRDIATNLFAVALAEEMYFRGFVQTHLKDAFATGAPVASDAPPTAVSGFSEGAKRVREALPAIILTSALFAITHLLTEVRVERAVVFFPAILFGVLRELRGGIGAAVFLHAASNLFEQWLEGR